MSFLSRTNSLVEHVRGFIHRPSQTKQNPIELGSLEATDVLGSSLHKEAVGGSRRSLKKVLLSAICVDYPNDRGQTPLFCACARENEANALLLLQYGANPNEKSQEGVTPSHVSSYVGNIRLLGKLIEAGGDLRLHDNNGHGVRDWAALNPDPKRRAKMLEFLDKTQFCAMAYTGDAVSADQFTRYTWRGHKHTSLMELMKRRSGNESTIDSLRRVQSMGFGKVYLGGDYSGGIVSVVPLVNETLLTPMDSADFDTGFGTFIEQMKWAHMQVSVKKVRPNVEPEEGIDNIISEAEYLGKLRHPNIVLLMGVCQSMSLEDMWLVFENFEEATLHYALHHAKSRLEFVRKQRIIGQVCNAMEFIHNQRLIHCGLSSMAVYLVSPHTAKVGNFEFMVESIKADLGKASRVTGVSHGKFLYNWMAPELMREESPHFSSDVYSFCCVIWEMFAGEVPWTGLDPEDIFDKVVDENIPLSLDYAPLPSRLKAIVGYGLELRQENRLHKFSLIGQWLRTEEIPEFHRSHSSLQWVNKSSNHPELTSSSSQSSSVPSCSSRGETAANTTQDCWTQDKPSISKRFSLDFENPVTTAVLSSRTIDLSQYSSAKRRELSPCSSDRELPPLKPPRSFAHDPLQNAPGSSKRSEDLVTQKNTTSQSPQRSSMGSVWEKTKSLPVSPSRIKPASHSYSCGLTCETDGTARPFPSITSTGETSPCEMMEKRPAGGTSTVKAMADKYQHVQNQHKLRQAILRGSMAPRGSCHHTSSESIKSDSFDSEGGMEPALSGHGRQACELESLNSLGRLSDLGSTPLLKSSSTPKTVLIHDPHTATDCEPHRATACEPHRPTACEPHSPTLSEPQTAQQVQESVMLSNARGSLDCLDQILSSAKNVEKVEDVKLEESSLDTKETNIQRRRAFIEDIKQKYPHLREKDSPDARVETSSRFAYHSPVLEFHSPHRGVATDKLRVIPLTIEEDSESKTTTGEKTQVGAMTTSEAEETLETRMVTLDRKPSPRGTSFEDDSFWAIKSMSQKENQCGMQGSDVGDGGKDVFNILHADYPEKGYRVIMKAEEKGLSTIYYQGGIQTTESSSEHPPGEITKSQAERSHSTPAEVSEVGVLPQSKATQLSEQGAGSSSKLATGGVPLQSQPSDGNGANHGRTCEQGGDNPHSNSQTSDITREVEGDSAEVKKSGEDEDPLDGTFTVEDKHDETFTLDPDSPAEVEPENISLAQESEKAVQWLDEQLRKIKDDLSHQIDSEADSRSSLCGIEDIPGVEGGGPGKVQTCVPCDTAEQNKSGRQDQQLSSDRPQASKDDFEYPEFYIDDDLNKPDQIQNKTEHSEPLPLGFETASDPTTEKSDLPPLLDPRTASSKDHIVPSSINRCHQSNLAPNSLASGSVSTGALYSKLMGRPPLILQSVFYRSENICQSAMSKNTEFEDVRQKVLSRRSASDKDLSVSKGVHLIARSQVNSRGREGVPVKPGSKQSSYTCDGLRSGASDPSFSTSLMRERGADASQQEATLADDTNFDDENTLMTMTQDLDEVVPGGTCRLQESKTKTAWGNTELDVDEKIRRKDEASQADLGGVAMRTQEIDSDSVESDLWVKSKLRAVQAKIQRRKARPEYVVSSDEDDTAWFPDLPLGPITSSAAKTRSFVHHPKSGSTLDVPKPNKCRSLLDIGVQMDENYSKVMEELKVTCRARRSHGSVPSRWSEETASQHSFRNKTGGPKQPTFITSSFVNQENFSGTLSKTKHHGESRSFTSRPAPGQSTEIETRSRNNGSETSQPSGVVTPKTGAETRRMGSHVGSQVSRRSHKSHDGEAGEESAQWKHNKGVKKEGHGRPILRNQSKESVVSSDALPPSRPRIKPKSSVSQTSKSVNDDLSFEDLTDVSEEPTDPRPLPPPTSRRTKFLPDHGRTSLRTTENWLREQNQRSGNVPQGSGQIQADSDRCSVTSGGRSLAGSSRSKHSIKSIGVEDPRQQSVTRAGKSLAHGSRSKHSIVSFSQVVDQDRRSNSSQHSLRSSQHHRHEGGSEESQSVRQTNSRGKKGSKPRLPSDKSNASSPGLVTCSQRIRAATLDEHRITVDLEKMQNKDRTTRRKERLGRDTVELHRFYLPKESWPDGCHAKLNVEVGSDSQRVTTTATNPASGLTETLLDQVFVAPKLKSTVHME